MASAIIDTTVRLRLDDDAGSEAITRRSNQPEAEQCRCQFGGWDLEHLSRDGRKAARWLDRQTMTLRMTSGTMPPKIVPRIGRRLSLIDVAIRDVVNPE